MYFYFLIFFAQPPSKVRDEYMQGHCSFHLVRCFHVGVMDRCGAVIEDIKLWNNLLCENSSTSL
jgi:hypothetical protein